MGSTSTKDDESQLFLLGNNKEGFVLVPRTYKINRLIKIGMTRHLFQLIRKQRAEDDGINETITRYHSTSVPGVRIFDYLCRICECMHLEAVHCIIALLYIKRLYYDKLPITKLTIHRIVLTCLVLSYKFTEDLTWRRELWAKVGGVSPKEITILEMDLLKRFDFILGVDYKEYNDCVQLVLTEAFKFDQKQCDKLIPRAKEIRFIKRIEQLELNGTIYKDKEKKKNTSEKHNNYIVNKATSAGKRVVSCNKYMTNNNNIDKDKDKEKEEEYITKNELIKNERISFVNA